MTKCCERDHDNDGNCDRHPARPLAVVMAKPTWTCVPCNEDVPKGEPCPDCGQQLLLD